MKDFIKRYAGILAICCVAVCAYTAIFVATKAYYHEHGSSYPVLESDAAEYVQLADNLRHHGAFSLATASPFSPEYFRVPGYPLFIAIILSLFGSVDAVIFVQILLTAASCFLIFCIAEKVSGSRFAAYLASGLFVCNPNTILFTLMVLSESLFVFVLLLSVYILICFQKSEEFRFAASGLLLGVSVLVRTIAMYMPLCFAILIFFTKQRSLKRSAILFGVFMCAFALVLLPWVVRNKVESGVFGISSTSAVNFYYYYVPLFIKNEHQLTTVSDLPQTEWKMDLAAAAVLQKESFAVVASQPLKYLQFHLTGIETYLEQSSLGYAWLFVFRPIYASNHSVFEVAAFEGTIRPYEHVEEFGMFGVVLLALMSILFIRKKEFFFFFWANILWFFVAAGPVATFSTRYRIPAEPFLMILASISIVGICTYGYLAVTAPRESYERARAWLAAFAGRIEAVLGIK